MFVSYPKKKNKRMSMSEIFTKLSSFRDNLFQGKQRELVNTNNVLMVFILILKTSVF